MTHVGFIGLGVMGSLFVERLLAKGHTVTGYNRTRAKAQPLLDRGMQWADSPRAVCEATDVTFAMVTNSAALEAIAIGPDGLLAGMGPGKIFVDMSTVSSVASRALAEKLREKGADMVDAPVSASVATLLDNRCSVMVGGRRETFERVRPILEDLSDAPVSGKGPRVTHVGDNGLALALKVATNLQLAVQMIALSEGVLLAEKSGIDRAIAVQVLTHSAIASPMVQYRGEMILKMPEEAWFNVDMMQKDMVLALEQGRRVDVPLLMTAAANEFLTAARGMGMAEQDFAIVFQVLARMAGLAK
jgi:3-hydroxyisobutyrate dehydrogenase-like beta-hydroxyacid dehydrogenase